MNKRQWKKFVKKVKSAEWRLNNAITDRIEELLKDEKFITQIDEELEGFTDMQAYINQVDRFVKEDTNVRTGQVAKGSNGA